MMGQPHLRQPWRLDRCKPCNHSLTNSLQGPAHRGGRPGAALVCGARGLGQAAAALPGRGLRGVSGSRLLFLCVFMYIRGEC